MGCSCSKAMARSMSIREDLSNTFQNASAAWEELFVSRNGNDHLFAFLRSGSNHTSPSKDIISDSEGKKGVDYSTPGLLEELEFARFTKSRSHQITRMDESKLDWKEKNQRGSRSFHTVEEYDALMGRLHQLGASGVRQPRRDSTESVAEDQTNARDGSCYVLAKEFEEEARVLGNLLSDEHDLGWKRKAAAKGLKSLDVPTIEFPAIARFRQRVQAEGQVYSPGTYVTPKFGSYNEKNAGSREKGSGVEESSPLCPELLAAFEDCLHQIEVEEIDIIRAMDEYKPKEMEST